MHAHQLLVAMGKKSKEKKALERLKSGTQRDQPEVVENGSWIHFRSTAPTTSFEAAATDGLHALETIYRIKWKPKEYAIQAELDKVLLPPDTTKEEDLRQCRKIIVMTTELLHDIESAFRGVGYSTDYANKEAVNNVVFVYPQPYCYHLRSLAYSRFEMFNECIEDCNTGLLLSECGMSKQAGFFQIAFLMKRGNSLRSLGRLDEAIVDFRAAVAAFRIKTETWEGWPKWQDAKTALLFTTCLQKIRLGRPYFTDEEREALFKEMSCGFYSKELYKCLECGKSSGLRLCSSCHHALFCGKECQTKAWKNHKKDCKASIVHIFIEDREAALQEIAQDGFIASESSYCGTPSAYPVIVTQDSKTGRTFDMIRNDVVVFGQFIISRNGKLNLMVDDAEGNKEGPFRFCHNRRGCPKTNQQLAMFQATE